MNHPLEFFGEGFRASHTHRLEQKISTIDWILGLWFLIEFRHEYRCSFMAAVDKGSLRDRLLRGEISSGILPLILDRYTVKNSA